MRHVLENSPHPCVGFSLVFLEHTGKDDVEYHYATKIASDPHSKLSEEKQKLLKLTFDFIAAGIKKIIQGVFTEDSMDDFTATGSFH